MAESNYKVPPFIKRDGNSLVYNGSGQLIFCVPERLFETKCVSVYGSTISLTGIFNYIQLGANGKLVGKVKPFNFPTVFGCKPGKIEQNISGKELNDKYGSFDPKDDYRLLIFNPGDVVVTNVHCTQVVDNVEAFFKLFMVNGKIPNTIPYDKIQDYYDKNIQLNGFDYGVTAQLFGICLSETCRDKDDPSKPFRNGKNIDKDMHSYNSIPITENPNYVDPFTSITSQYYDESLMSAVLLSKEDAHKAKNSSPLERVMTK